MNRMEALKRLGGSNERKRRVKTSEGTTYREQKGRVEKLKRKGRSSEGDYKELKRNEGSKE